jgi:hypothetical protein
MSEIIKTIHKNIRIIYVNFNYYVKVYNINIRIKYLEKENKRQDKWVGFYRKCHIQKMSICIVLIYRFLNLLDFQYF